MPALPSIGQTFVRYDLQYLAVNDAVPRAGWRSLKGETLALYGLKPGRFHLYPAPHEFVGGKRFPDRLGRMRQDLIKHDVLRVRLRCGIAHGSISFRSRHRSAHRSRGKTP